MRALTRVSGALVGLADWIEQAAEGRVDLGGWVLMSRAARQQYAQMMLRVGADAALRDGRNPWSGRDVRREGPPAKVLRLI